MITDGSLVNMVAPKQDLLMQVNRLQADRH